MRSFAHHLTRPRSFYRERSTFHVPFYAVLIQLRSFKIYLPDARGKRRKIQCRFCIIYIYSHVIFRRFFTARRQFVLKWRIIMYFKNTSLWFTHLFTQFYTRLTILAFLLDANIRRRYDLVKEWVLHSSSRGQKRMPKGQSLDGLLLRGWRMDSNSQGWNGSFRRTYPTQAVDNHRLMEPGDLPNDRRRSKREGSEMNERERKRECAMERERVYFEETGRPSRKRKRR